MRASCLFFQVRLAGWQASRPAEQLPLRNALNAMSGLGARKASQSELQTPRTRVDNEEDVELKYKLGRELGRGAFGVVLEGTQLPSGKVFAVKVIPKERVSEVVW